MYERKRSMVMAAASPGPKPAESIRATRASASSSKPGQTKQTSEAWIFHPSLYEIKRLMHGIESIEFYT
jgi:hypothetical protein